MNGIVKEVGLERKVWFASARPGVDLADFPIFRRASLTAVSPLVYRRNRKSHRP